MGDGGVYANEFRMADWASDKREIWEKVCEKYGGSKDAFDCGTWGFFDWSIGKAWPTISSISKARKFGWNRYDDTFETWCETFRMFANAGILPRQQAVMTASTNGTYPPLSAGKTASKGAVNGVNGSLEHDDVPRVITAPVEAFEKAP